jgi:hypothetical protein
MYPHAMLWQLCQLELLATGRQYALVSASLRYQSLCCSRQHYDSTIHSLQCLHVVSCSVTGGSACGDLLHEPAHCQAAVTRGLRGERNSCCCLQLQTHLHIYRFHHEPKRNCIPPQQVLHLPASVQEERQMRQT